MIKKRKTNLKNIFISRKSYTILIREFYFEVAATILKQTNENLYSEPAVQQARAKHARKKRL